MYAVRRAKSCAEGSAKGEDEALKLTEDEQAMLAGDGGEPRRWAMEHMLRVGGMFDAQDLVPVSQAHMMVDPESIGVAGVEFFESLASHPEPERRVVIPMITDPRGVDLNYYRPLGQTEEMADIDRRTIAACEKMGILMTNTCVNYQTVMAPVKGEHVAFGDTGVVIYSNSVQGAYSNFEGGPSALAAGLTGRTPRYGLHLEENRRGTKRFVVRHQPREFTDWGVLGAIIGRQCGSYWEVPVIEGIDAVPTSDDMKHFGAAMASYGSTPLFHLVGITPEAPTLAAVWDGEAAPRVEITKADFDALRSDFGGSGDKVDVVVFAAPQLSIIEMAMVAQRIDGQKVHPDRRCWCARLRRWRLTVSGSVLLTRLSVLVGRSWWARVFTSNTLVKSVKRMVGPGCSATRQRSLTSWVGTAISRRSRAWMIVWRPPSPGRLSDD